MSVTLIDPPGPLQNTFEPIDFTTTSKVVSISIEFNPQTGNGLRETVWDGTDDSNEGGDFSFLYRNSTVTGSGPYSWTVRRSGRWPADFRIRIKEAGSGGNAYWQEIYNVDFRTLPNYTVNSYGPHVFDGLTWYCKQGQTNNFINNVNGVGLLVGSSPGSAENGGGTFHGPRLLLPMTNVPGFNPLAPVAFVVRTSRPAGAAPLPVAVCGVADCSLAITPVTANEYLKMQGISAWDGNDGSSFDGTVFIWGRNTNVGGSAPIGALPEEDAGLVIKVLDRKAVAYSVFDWSSSIPDLTTGALFTPVSNDPMLYLNLGTDVSDNQLFRNMNNLSFYVAYNNNQGISSPAYLLELSILQPRV